MKQMLAGRRGVVLRMSLMIILLLFGTIDIAGAGDVDTHTVTVIVTTINEIAMASALTLTIDTAVAGSEPIEVSDNTTCDLAWTTNEEDNKKITVETSLNQQNFTLKVLAINVSGGGTAQPEVTISKSTQDFIVDINKTVGGCDLQYTASATTAQGTGTDAHTITYTLTDA